ncbi:YgaP family membrane protein [Bacillus sp. Marseille-P3661]|uniref:YgaP family membrane protein n=1 Tax=Bacillus sp. Marseille-P3661 TaxID=1936234 RepID=UPI000C841E3B|nr:DUF2892 domain-containing protein [Bacillus sp. Marseille-P3661]
MIKPNIGIVNALVRITFGLAMLSWSTAKMVKRPWRESYFFVAVMAAMKVAEGITKFCPLTALFEQYQQQQNQNGQQQQGPNQQQQQHDSTDSQKEVVNPS